MNPNQPMHASPGVDMMIFIIALIAAITAAISF